MHTVTALVDPGSQITLISERAAQTLQLGRAAGSISIATVGHNHPTVSTNGLVNVKLTLSHTTDPIQAELVCNTHTHGRSCEQYSVRTCKTKQSAAENEAETITSHFDTTHLDFEKHSTVIAFRSTKPPTALHVEPVRQSSTNKSPFAHALPTAASCRFLLNNIKWDGHSANTLHHAKSPIMQGLENMPFVWLGPATQLRSHDHGRLINQAGQVTYDCNHYLTIFSSYQ